MNKRREKDLDDLEKKKWEEMRQMEDEIKMSIQVKHFMEERREIKSKGIQNPNDRTERIKKGSSLNPHNPFIDEKGLIRVGSRLIHSDLPEEAKCPVILPKNDTNVTDLIKHVCLNVS